MGHKWAGSSLPYPPSGRDIGAPNILHFPLQEPMCLVRAALVCKSWWCLIFDSAFSSRFCEFHHASLMLRFLYNQCCLYNMEIGHRFVLTTSFVPATIMTITTSCSSHTN
jgi:hypothetical protein